MLVRGGVLFSVQGADGTASGMIRIIPKGKVPPPAYIRQASSTCSICGSPPAGITTDTAS